MKISQFYNLGKSQYELDFIDVDPECDMPLFLDPYFLSKSDTVFGRKARILLKDFFCTLLGKLSVGKILEAQELFSYLGETNELCLGLSKGTPSGKGMGPKDADRIFNELLNSKALDSGLIEDIEDFRIFVHNVDKDKISDMTANIIKSLLVEYTIEQCNLLGIPLNESVPTGYYWDKDTHSWENRFECGLICNGHRVLLVPKRYVSFSKEYCPDKYYQHFVLNFLQNEHLRLNSPLVNQRKDGTRYVTKKSIDKSLNIIDKKAWLVSFTEHHKAVFNDFKANMINRMEAVENTELTDISLTSVCEFLANKLTNLSAGNRESANFQHIILGIFELLFYPSFACLKEEETIHDGRKRIDITFDNCAEKGFFYRLCTTNNIPANLIMIECKNYSQDIANPELDQLIGRFSAKRGNFGFSVSRKFKDRETIIKRCQDAYSDNKYVIFPIEDIDLIELLTVFPTEGECCVERFLQNMWHEIITN